MGPLRTCSQGAFSFQFDLETGDHLHIWDSEGPSGNERLGGGCPDLRIEVEFRYRRSVDAPNQTNFEPDRL
jgi:hypothetical protein